MGSPEAEKARAEQDKLAAFVRKQIGTIWVADLADTMSTMVTKSMENLGINSLKDAAEKIGKVELSKAEEIVQHAGLHNPGLSNDLEPQLLKEWMEGAAEIRQQGQVGWRASGLSECLISCALMNLLGGRWGLGPQRRAYNVQLAPWR